MAMILEAFVGCYVSKLAGFIEEKVVMVLGVKDELKGLQEKLESIQGLLEDAERRRLHDPAINRWVAKLKDIMYDADDIIDLCKIKGAKRGRSSDDQASTSLVGNLGVSHLFSMLPSRSDLLSAHDIARRIKTLNGRLKEVTEDRIVLSRLGCSNTSVTTSGLNPRQTSPLVEFDLVGRDIEDATKGLVKKLVKEDIRKCCIFAIDGMGGIGKTALAQKIYNDPNIVDSFQTRIWVCVSQEFSEIEVLNQMLKGAVRDHKYLSTKAELLPMLRDAVSGKRLFVVLDDVWQANVWIDLLQNPLQNGVAIGRILVTTRDKNIAKRMGAVHTHKVELLPENSGWELLCKKVFASGEEAEMEMLRDIGTQIVQKCHGLPLAIKTIAGLLTTKDKSRNEWEKVLRSDAWFMSNLPEELRGALYLSYEDLPAHLKQCFLYFALFPEDYRFDRFVLVRFWVAEGFVKTQQDTRMEELAEQYYEELIRRNILQPINVERDVCKMHDLLRTLSQFLSKDENFYGDVDELKATTLPKLRRLAIGRRRGETAAVPSFTIIERNCLRTLILFQSLSSLQNDLLVRLTHLRILHLYRSDIETIPDSIGTLIHLRLLDLGCTNVSTLPESLGFLTNLQILNLSWCCRLQTLPKSITRLFNLRCLAFSSTSLSFVPKGIGKLQQLAELKGFVVGDDGNGGEEAQGCELEELQSLSRLRILHIHRLERASNRARILDNKPYLKELMLSCRPKDVMADEEIHRIEEIFEDLTPPRCIEHLDIINFFGRRYPGWMMSSSLQDYLSNLKYLKLFGCKSRLELLPLGQLPQLIALEIYRATAVVSIGIEFLGSGVRQGSHTTFFPKLEKLRLYLMREWKEWEISGQAASQSALLLPRLKNLQLLDCFKLRAFPDSFKQATMMQSLHIVNASELREVENLPFLSNWLHISYSKSLEKVSNLPAIKTLSITKCSALRCVENLDALQRLELYDESMDILPEWILRLLQERQYPHQNNLQLILRCNVRMLSRCLRGRPDWPIIQQFSEVHASTDTGEAYLHYTKVPSSYQTNLESDGSNNE